MRPAQRGESTRPGIACASEGADGAAAGVPLRAARLDEDALAPGPRLEAAQPRRGNEALFEERCSAPPAPGEDSR